MCDFWRKLGGDFTLGGRKKIRAKEREREHDKVYYDSAGCTLPSVGL